MDPINFPEKTESSQRILKNASINTESFFYCAFCGSKNYLQPFSQANCFPAFTSDFTRLGPCEKGYSGHEPVFSSPPLFQRLFQNKFVPPNVFYSNMNVASSASSDFANNQIENDLLKQPSPYYMFYQSPRESVSSNDKKEARKDENIESGSKTNFESRISCSPICSCNAIPWSCSPCIVPMISYLVSWRPTFTNKIVAEPNVSNVEEESMEKNNSCNILKSPIPNQSVIQKDEKNVFSPRIPEKSKKAEWKVTCEFKESSTSFVSMASLDNNEEELFSSEKKRGDESKTSSHYKADFIMGKKFPGHLEELEEVSATDDETNSVSQLDGSKKENEIYRSDFIHDNVRDSFIIDSSIPSTEVNSDAESCAFEAVIPKNENYDEETIGDDQESTPSVMEGSKSRDRNIKKLITNFTMSDEYKTEPEEESNECEGNCIAAAGDVSLNPETESKSLPEHERVASELADSNSQENLLVDLEAGERLRPPVKGTDKKKQPKNNETSSKIASINAKTKNTTPLLNSNQEDLSGKKSPNVEKRKLIHPVRNSSTKTNAESPTQNQQMKIRSSTVQSKVSKNLKVKTDINYKENLTKRKDAVKNLSVGQSIALEKDVQKSVSRSRK